MRNLFASPKENRVKVLGIMQNMVQFESSYHTKNEMHLKLSRVISTTSTGSLQQVKAGGFFTYIRKKIANSGILSLSMNGRILATEWYFIMYMPERIYCTKAK